MSLDPVPESRYSTAERAAYWLLTLQSEDLAAAKREELIDWLRESPRHISELLRAVMLQRDLARFKGWHRILPMDDSDVSQIVTRLEVRRRISAHRPLRRRIRITQRVAISVAVSSAIVLCILGTWVFTRLNRTVLTTQLAERREVTLADGSAVDLAPDSEVAIRYGARERLLTLDRGEALFEVAKNPDRPFIVQAAETRVRALGTVFDVRRGNQGVSVTVVEGQVSVSQQHPTEEAVADSDPQAMPLMLGADQQVTISRQGWAATVRKVRSAAIVSWASGELVFDNQTIDEIADRFNLYNRIQIRVVDRALGARRMSGVFDADDPQSFVALVETVTGTHTVRRDANVIMLGAQATHSVSNRRR